VPDRRGVNEQVEAGPDTRLADYMQDVGPAGIVLFEPAPPFRVLSANKAYLKLWPEPLRSKGLVGLALTDFVPDAEETGVAAVFREVAATRVAREVEEFPYTLADGPHWFHWTLAPVVRDGALVALANMEIDVTREVKARKEAERARDEVRYEAELLELGDAFCELDAGFRVVRVNARQEQLTGLSRAESIGKTHWELWPESGQPESPLWREYHRCMSERVPVQFQNYYAPLDLWSDVTAYPTSSGGIAIFFRDITHRRRAEEAVRDSEQRFRSVLENMSEGLMLFDAKGNLTYQNPASLRIHGFDPASDGRIDRERLPVTWEAWDVQERPIGFEEWPVSRVFRGERFQDQVLHVRRVETGQEFYGSYNGSPIRDAQGRIALGFITIRDITDARRAEQALRGANEQLREAARRKDEFLGMLSHELRNPLAPIRNSIYILRRAEAGSEQAARAQGVIERQTEHLTRIVDDLLDVTRIARGKFELRRSWVDLREVVSRAAEDFRLLFRDRGVAFEVAVPDEKLWADLDATRISQAVGNLLHNASKFTRPGDTVRISLETSAEQAVIRVRDSGAGIDPALLPSVFEPFVQGERTLARTEGGLGLGLALVKGMAELHGGTVRASSAGKGQGAELVVSLPLPLPSRAAADARGTPSAPRAEGGRRVLVVDDNADAAESLAELAAFFGHSVEIALDGPAAVAKARASPPDLVLCDLGLPGMTGYEVARALRAACGPGIQLVAVSGYAQPEDVRRAIEAGFDAHVAKPPDPAEIERLLAG
jgi:PAS domain S-box-containing protein